ncbi:MULTISPECIES: PLP-dependent aminotransferase family protein [Mycobacterium]|uniref:MocR-like transcription factor YczR n=1 Tax=Mycobacterium TaxID=1763 RepID=UPI0009609260|nr:MULTISPECIES: PLP-dependent aminotransferase family protein [Mycobacterium]MCG7606788.1 PLP-dependent aminotransferase family protein [Mycobacterium sp. CnD-18-1]OLT98291.1 GntR family transcriptional regulator [Mycobacterium syngnathidarum]
MSTAISPQRLARLVGDFDRAPAYRGLRETLQELIGDGRIPIGTRLPSERTVTAALGVSRTTVTRAYADLVEAGFAVARQGSGTFAAVPVERRKVQDRARHPLGMSASSGDVVDLSIAAGSAAPGTMAAYERALAALPSYLSGDGYLPSGLPDLQGRIAESFTRRGLPTDSAQIVVTSGALAGIGIVARALTRPGDRVMVESPVYSNAVDALRLGGARLVSSPLADPSGHTGWDLDGVAAALRQTAPRLAYLIPDFQNPTGFLMNEAERVRYAESLRQTRTTAVVDETMQPLNFTDEAPPAPFASFEPSTITIGSASKAFWGGLRIGWIRAPKPLVDRIIAARMRADLGTSLLDQLVVTELLTDEGIIERRCDELRQRRDHLAAALRRDLPEWRFRLPGGGVCLWVRLPSGSATRLAIELERHGVRVAPGPVFTVEGGSDAWLRIPFCKPHRELVAAVRLMAELWPHANGAPGRIDIARALIT